MKSRLYFRGENGDLADPLFEMNKRKIAVRIRVVRRLVQLREGADPENIGVGPEEIVNTFARGTLLLALTGARLDALVTVSATSIASLYSIRNLASEPLRSGSRSALAGPRQTRKICVRIGGRIRPNVVILKGPLIRFLGGYGFDSSEQR